ncbi:conjugal transfer protein TraI [Mucilaginibacter sp. UR6-1]|uniref:conjugal transfer protein TraI n=1 Tax=Mucilaginibacter sp. UR6-1 TaxID=1435643 RepID=UPI001E3F1C97|nr:conjugal transfer protein TraI [Mucilaginibacter sp. UR6-1]MCC8409328.1 conjugal transfer protein TraI [Mucilaginibacter sp. UR6-1]
MKKYIRILGLALVLWVAVPTQETNAQIPGLDFITGAVKRVVKAIDLRIQRLQNKTIWLQNAQKTLENALSKLKLDEIADWTEKQKEQYAKYYEELAKVKAIISYYQRIRDITQKQVRLVQEYQRAWNLLQQDEHFTADEIEYMGKVYAGILEESLKNIDQITLVVESFATTMSDAKRLELINEAADRVDENYSDLTRFNRQNAVLSLQRSKDAHEADVVRKLYGIQ